MLSSLLVSSIFMYMWRHWVYVWSLTTIEKNLLLHRNCKRIIETISQSFWPKLYGPIVVWLGWSPFYNYVQKQSLRSLWNAAKPDTYYVWLIFLNHHKCCCGSSKRDLLFIYHCRTPGKIPINDTHNGKKKNFLVTDKIHFLNGSKLHRSPKFLVGVLSRDVFQFQSCFGRMTQQQRHLGNDESGDFPPF